jgi:hypothetical protein
VGLRQIECSGRRDALELLSAALGKLTVLSAGEITAAAGGWLLIFVLASQAERRAVPVGYGCGAYLICGSCAPEIRDTLTA